MIQRKLGGLANVAKARNAVAFSAVLTKIFIKACQVVISKDHEKGHIKNCDGLPSYFHRPVTISE